MNLKQEQAWFTKRLKELADPKRAKNQKRYLKSSLKFYGVRVPELRKLAKTWLKSHQALPVEKIFPLVQKLWASNYHEQRLCAIFLLVYRHQDLTWQHLSVVEQLVKTSTGWAELDMIAAWLCGAIFKESPRRMEKVLKRWNQDENFWVRRASLLTLLGPVRKDPQKIFPLFDELATPLLLEKEFFIRKAIGWVLRELSKSQPKIVYQYVRDHQGKMAGLTFREATKYLPQTLRSKLQ